MQDINKVGTEYETNWPHEFNATGLYLSTVLCKNEHM
jgi:hypothetical protein